jgi:hypothetical protein
VTQVLQARLERHLHVACRLPVACLHLPARPLLLLLAVRRVARAQQRAVPKPRRRRQPWLRLQWSFLTPSAAQRDGSASMTVQAAPTHYEGLWVARNTTGTDSQRKVI